MILSIFNGLFDGDNVDIEITDFLLCLGVSLVLGLIIAFVYMYKTKYTKSFVVTLALLPAVVCAVILMVNGNIGAGVAVAGAFSLVRFRSAPGSAKEIVTIFLAMVSGLIAGMGYVAISVVFTLIMAIMYILYSVIDFGKKKQELVYKTIKITIPEDLDYTNVFQDLFDKYTSSCELIRVKTVNLGSMFRLTYDITLKDSSKEKEFIDKIRCRNGNLEITMSKQENINGEL